MARQAGLPGGYIDDGAGGVVVPEAFPAGGPPPAPGLAALPAALQTLTATIRESAQPILVACGTDALAWYNPAFAALIGDRHPALLGRPLFQAWPDLKQPAAAIFRRALDGAPGQTLALAIDVPRGGIAMAAHCRVALSPVRDGGAVVGVLGVWTDMTQSVLDARRHATLLDLLALLKDRRDPRSIVDAAVGTLGRALGAQRVGYGEVQADDTTIRLETSYVDDAAALHGTFVLDDFGPATIAANRGGQTVAIDDVTRHPGPQAQWAAISTRAFASVPLVRDARLRATLYVNYRTPHAWSAAELALIEDVAALVWEALERARAEDALRQSETRLALSEESLRLATEAAEVGIWDLDLGTGALTWTARTKTMFGIAADVTCTLDDFYGGLHPEDRDATAEAFAAALDPARRQAYDVEFRTVGRDDGTVRWIAAKGLGLFDADGRCVRALGTAIDVTARRQAAAHLRQQNEALLRTQESLAAIFGASEEGLTLCRLMRDAAGAVTDYQVLDVNPAHQRLTGATRAQMLAQPVTKIATPIDPRWLESAGRAVETGLPQRFEVYSRPTGRWLDIHVSPVSADLFAQTFIDVTWRRAADEQRIRLVAEMNHRVKNNFQMVASVLALQARRSPGVQVRQQLESAQRRIQVLAELHDSLAAAPDAGQVDFGAYLTLLCGKLRGAIEAPERIGLVVRADSAAIDPAVAVPLGFVVNELVTNAMKYAFPAPAKGKIRVVFSAQSGAHVLEVSDDGRGMTDDTEAQGSGLGMRLVRSFVDQAGASLEIGRAHGLSYRMTFSAGPRLGGA